MFSRLSVFALLFSTIFFFQNQYPDPQWDPYLARKDLLQSSHSNKRSSIKNNHESNGINLSKGYLVKIKWRISSMLFNQKAKKDLKTNFNRFSHTKSQMKCQNFQLSELIVYEIRIMENRRISNMNSQCNNEYIL